MKTLDEIRAENKAAEEAEAKSTPPVKQDDLEDDDSDVTPPAAVAAPEKPKAPDGSQPKADDDGSPQEDWMAEDDAKGSGMQVPATVVAKLRSKLRDTKAESTAEIEKLRAELNQLKQAVTKPAIADIPPAPLKPPVPQEYQTVEEYQAAVSRYTTAEVQRQMALVNQTQNAKARQDAAIDTVTKAVDSHYERAAELVKANSISPEVYQNADLKVRQSIATVFPDAADKIVDDLIANMGAGSEKVMYFLGRNEAARNTLIAKLTQDGRGIAASMYLGQLVAQKAGNPANTSSMAPAPSPRVKGTTGGAGTSNVEELKKKYDSAHKKGDTQSAFNLKREAKLAGISTVSW